jgi:hypothetical protein
MMKERVLFTTITVVQALLMLLFIVYRHFRYVSVTNLIDSDCDKVSREVCESWAAARAALYLCKVFCELT